MAVDDDGEDSTHPTKLRRSLGAWAAHGGVLTPIAVVVILGFVSKPRLAAIPILVVLILLSFTPLLLGAEVRDGHVLFGYRWNRQTIQIGDIREICIGLVSGFGAYGSAANGMMLLLNDGSESLIRESQFCSSRRLAAWAQEVRIRNTAIQVCRRPMSRGRTLDQ